MLRYVADLRRWDFAQELLIDGSFVTAAATPNDIDVVLVLRADYDLLQEVSPFEYNLRSHTPDERRPFR
jgi:5'-3' exonuclease